MKKSFNIITVMAALLLHLPLTWATSLELHGAFYSGYTERINGNNPGTAMRQDGRLLLEITGELPRETLLLIKLDLTYDDVLDKNQQDSDDSRDHLELREAYLEHTFGPLDLRVGRQIITWGVADRLFISDVFPKSWSSFYLGRPLADLKLGSDAVRANYYGDKLELEFVYIPVFRSDQMPGDAGGAWELPPYPELDTDYPHSWRQAQSGVRINYPLGQFEQSLYLFTGNYTTPGSGMQMAHDGPNLFYPELNMYSYTLQGNVGEGVLKLSGGYYHSVDDPAGDNPLIINSQIRALLGYDRQLGSDLSGALQFYLEQMEDYEAYTEHLPASHYQEEERKYRITLGLDQFLLHQTLHLSLFVIYEHAESEYIWQPQLAYQVTDNLHWTVGANIIDGGEHPTMIGSMQENDNFHTSMRYNF